MTRDRSPGWQATSLDLALLGAAIAVVTALIAQGSSWSMRGTPRAVVVDSAVHEARLFVRGRGPDTLHVFLDYTCRFCQEQEAILQAWLAGRPENAAVAFYAFPLDTLRSTRSYRATAGALCAGALGLAEEAHRLLFLAMSHPSPRRDVTDDLRELFGEPDQHRLEECVNDDETWNRILRARAAAGDVGVRSTPSSVFRGVLMRGIRPIPYLDSLMAADGFRRDRAG
jgi:protein-disulfide isomerase